MKKLLVLASAACVVGTATAQVGVSINIAQPGVYGRIQLGDFPRPALVMPQPVIIAPPAYRVERSPIYLYVPTAHQRDWRRYCGRYSACNQPVYFVRDEWVRERYAQQHPGWDRGRHRGWDRGSDRRDHDRGRDHDGRGPGRDRRD
jgi:hypothetical protein